MISSATGSVSGSAPTNFSSPGTAAPAVLRPTTNNESLASRALRAYSLNAKTRSRQHSKANDNNSAGSITLLIMPLDVAASQIRTYGSMPISVTFSSNDEGGVMDDSDTVHPAYSAAFDANDGVKRHAACDECRKRKLKCSGEPTGCSRCVKQSLVCHYSEQKQMGRPRKRQRTDDPSSMSNTQALSPPRAIQPAPDHIREKPQNEPVLDPALALMHQERAQFESICNAPMARTVREQRQYALQENQAIPSLQESNSDTSHSQNGAHTPEAFDPFSTSYPTDVAQWPDFSSLDMLPIPVDDKWRGFENSPATGNNIDPDANPEALSNLPPVPACPCLPNLYLTLSTLSTLSSFPFTQQTINTVETAFRTAKGVIYCSVCPQKFDTGSSNLMLACTLLNVLSDQWNRLRRLQVDELRKAFGTPDQQQHAVTIKEATAWRKFAHQMLRAYVFGDSPIPVPPDNGRSPSVKPYPEEVPARYPPLTLMGLCDALTRRQRQWHDLDEPTDEFPARVTPDLTHGHIVGDEKNGKHLCLEIVNHARCIVDGLNGPSPTGHLHK